MSIYIKPNVYVTICQYEGENSPRPLPLQSGFIPYKKYEILGIHSASETAEAFLILKNDRDEMWFISNRHCRISDAPEVKNANLMNNPNGSAYHANGSTVGVG